MPKRDNFSLKRTLSVWDNDGQSFIGYVLYAIADHLKTRGNQDGLQGNFEYFLNHGTHSEVRIGHIQVGTNRKLLVEDFGDGQYSIRGLPVNYDMGTFENAVQAKLDERFAFYRQEQKDRDERILSGKEKHRESIIIEETEGKKKKISVSSKG